MAFRVGQIQCQLQGFAELPDRAERTTDGRIVVADRSDRGQVDVLLFDAHTRRQLPRAELSLFEQEQAEIARHRCRDEGLRADGFEIEIAILQSESAAPSCQWQVLGRDAGFAAALQEHGAELAAGLDLAMLVIVPAGAQTQIGDATQRLAPLGIEVVAGLAHVDVDAIAITDLARLARPRRKLRESICDALERRARVFFLFLARPGNFVLRAEARDRRADVAPVADARDADAAAA